MAGDGRSMMQLTKAEAVPAQLVVTETVGRHRLPPMMQLRTVPPVRRTATAAAEPMSPEKELAWMRQFSRRPLSRCGRPRPCLPRICILEGAERVVGNDAVAHGAV
jgi:hypothetical protein